MYAPLCNLPTEHVLVGGVAPVLLTALMRPAYICLAVVCPAASMVMLIVGDLCCLCRHIENRWKTPRVRLCWLLCRQRMHSLCPR
jgi:hypothetical protein